MDETKLKASIIQHEGTGPVKNGQFMPYGDSLGNPTIGYGHLIANGVSGNAADQILSDDIAISIQQCEAEAWWPNVSGYDARANACVELMFILGPAKFAGFHNADVGLLASNFDIAADEIIDSALDHEDGERINSLAEMIRTNNFPAQ
jgi:hypothetical protein